MTRVSIGIYYLKKKVKNINPLPNIIHWLLGKGYMFYYEKNLRRQMPMRVSCFLTSYRPAANF